MTRKRKAENDAKKPKGKKNKKNGKKKGRALETSGAATKQNGQTCKSNKSLEKIPTYDLNKIPEGLLSIRDISDEKKRQVERQLELDGLEYSFELPLAQD